MPRTINPNITYVGSALRQARYAMSQRHAMRYLMHRARWSLLPRWRRVSAFPEHVDIETASACQMACPMCFQTVRGDVPRGVMDPALFRRVMDEVAARRPYSIRLSWRGECLLHPQFAELLAYARRRFSGSISFLTNALALDDALMERIVAAQTDYIVISADGVGRTYEAVRRPARFDDLVRKLERLRDIRRANGSRFPRVRINAVSTWLTAGERREFVQTFQPLTDAILIGEMLSNFAEYAPPHDPDAFCASPWQRLLVGWDGSVHPCCCDVAGKYSLGNVADEPLAQMWRGERLTALRRAIASGRRLSIPLCRDTDCGVDENDNEASEEFMDLLRAQVMRQHGADSPLLGYLRGAARPGAGEEAA
ncbi:radical SAM/SPASM domain-containing protein [Desulfobaculum sp. SPO524]|uniref:radical SAM/SPASM domain-containing protein n=1 Tax=Desulfobaculum sp. SPO524 TaxID=3378071 RepID=UPI0038521455